MLTSSSSLQPTKLANCIWIEEQKWVWLNRNYSPNASVSTGPYFNVGNRHIQQKLQCIVFKGLIKLSLSIYKCLLSLMYSCKLAMGGLLVFCQLFVSNFDNLCWVKWLATEWFPWRNASSKNILLGFILFWCGCCGGVVELKQLQPW